MSSKYAITEIITTGLNFKLDRIIHISTFIIEDNEIKRHLTSYINPERTLEPEFIRSTGIVNDNIKFSPKFYEKAKELITLWDNAILVSSNPRLTFTFLKSEFKALGFPFNMNHNSFYQYADKTELDLERIEDKARVLSKIFLDKGNHTRQKKDYTPRAYLEKELKLMPNECGIYILKNENGSIIYVGKAIKIRTRLRQHFRNLNNKGFKIHRMVSAIDYKITKSELFALLLEQHHILKYKPELNKALRNESFKYELRYHDNGDETLIFTPSDKSHSGHILKKFRNKKSALAFAVKMTIEFQMNLDQIKFVGINKSKLIQSIDVLQSDVDDQINNGYPLSDIVEYINPFYKGKYVIHEKGFHDSQAIIENGRFLGLTLNQKMGTNYEKLKNNLGYIFQSEYALNQIITYHRKGLLQITRH